MSWLTETLVSIGIVAAGAAAGAVVYFVARHTLPRLPRWQSAAKPIFGRCWGGLRLLLPILPP